MDSPYRIKIIPCQNGERFPILVDRNNGMPLYYPNLYLTTAVRGAAKQDKTLLKYIQAIKFVYDWGIKYNINLEHRFNAGEFLKLHEIEALVGDIYARADNLLDNSVPTTNNPSINRIKKGMKLEIVRCGYSRKKIAIVNSSTASSRLRSIRNYLDWLSSKKISRVNSRATDYVVLSCLRTEMLGLINARISSAQEQSLLNPIMGMDKETEKRLLEIIAIDSPENPWRDERIKARNQLFIYLLLFLGIRKGEALGLRVTDINILKNTVTVHRTPDDITDPRPDQPQTKTKGRELVMKGFLASMCHEYIVKYRSKNLVGARRNHFLFVGTKSGNPISITTSDDIFDVIKRKLPEFKGKITPHVMRHTANDRFSELADEKIRSGEWTVEDEKSARCAQMGWVNNSEMGINYTKRHIAEKTNQISMESQERGLNAC